MESMTVVNGKLTYGKTECTCALGDNSATAGKQRGTMACPKCHGTNRTRGGNGKHRCNNCLDGKVVDMNPANMVECERCHGTGTEDATRYDSIPEHILMALPIRVDRNLHPYTWNEAYIGMGHLVSVTDYGDCHKLSDEQLIAATKTEHLKHVQACKVATKDDVLCRGIVIRTNRMGYTVDAEF